MVVITLFGVTLFITIKSLSMASLLKDEVKVTRKYQVTIPKSIRSKLGVNIGDRLVVKSEDNRIVMEPVKHVSNPSDVLWNIFGKPIRVDAAKLVEDSWKEHESTKKT